MLYLMSWASLKLNIIVDKAVGETDNEWDVAGRMYITDKSLLRKVMYRLYNS